MGDVIVTLRVKSSTGSRARALPLYFDSGASTTLVREDTARRLGNVLSLREPTVFRGLGNGRFRSSKAVQILVRIQGVWCAYLAYVVPQAAMDEAVIIGHDFMQKFNIRLDPRGRKILADRRDLKRGQRVYRKER